MRQYLDLLRDVKENGVDRMDRTGVGTRSVFGRQMRFDLSKGFPLLTTKKVYWKGVVYELLWFLKGNTNTKYLVDHNVHIWDEWADENGDLGPVYGAQWRNWGGYLDPEKGIDQLSELIHLVKTNPHSRRLILNAWNVDEIRYMALPPCHMMAQFYVANGKLSCQLYQRSCDVFLGLPFNIASYSLLTHMIASICGLEVGEFVWTGGDTHLYLNHLEQAEKQLQREPFHSPRVVVNKLSNIEKYTYDDIKLIGYQYHPAIPAPIAV